MARRFACPTTLSSAAPSDCMRCPYVAPLQEIDSKLSTQLYLNASSKASAPTLGNQDYIAALKGPGGEEEGYLARRKHVVTRNPYSLNRSAKCLQCVQCRGPAAA